MGEMPRVCASRLLIYVINIYGVPPVLALGYSREEGHMVPALT